MKRGDFFINVTTVLPAYGRVGLLRIPLRGQRGYTPTSHECQNGQQKAEYCRISMSGDWLSTRFPKYILFCAHRFYGREH